LGGDKIKPTTYSETLTGQFTEKPTRDQSRRELITFIAIAYLYILRHTFRRLD